MFHSGEAAGGARGGWRVDGGVDWRAGRPRRGGQGGKENACGEEGDLELYPRGQQYFHGWSEGNIAKTEGTASEAKKWRFLARTCVMYSVHCPRDERGGR